jgi:hypothetical protein
MVIGDVFPDEDDHPSSFSKEGKNAWNYTSTPLYVFMVFYLIKYRDKLYSQQSRRWGKCLATVR